VLLHQLDFDQQQQLGRVDSDLHKALFVRVHYLGLNHFLAQYKRKELEEIRVAVITISPDQITKKKRKGPKGHAIDLKALEEVQALLAGESRQRDLLIEHLHKIQDQYQHISSKHLVALAHEMKLSPAEIYEVASFYHHFDIVKEGQTPPPPLTVRVCESLSCAMAGSNDLITALENGLNPDNVRVQY
jgi:formate dehydrogenase